ncbi:hypothetical protein [Endozoicomonas atrinae]|uniref:hypothetical protein n=1 Tax=Endozoicomonas atrinae TaxID=1333660 RepID=UPI003B004B5D
MHSVHLSKSSIEQLLAAKRQIKKEFGEVISLSDEGLVVQLREYFQKTVMQETRQLLQECVKGLGEEVVAPVSVVTPVWEPAKRIYRGQVVND